MKKLHFLSAVVVLFTAFHFSSCSSEFEPVDPAIVIPDPTDPTDPDPTDPETGTFKVDFDGQTYIATTTQAIVNSEYVAITAIRGASAELFQLTIPHGAVGTYTWDSVGPTGVLAMAYAPSSGSEGYIAAQDGPDGEFSDFPGYVDTATITISSINATTHRIKGTFQFTGVRFADESGETIQTKVFTNGSFDLPYTADVVAPTGNSFTAKLDGAVFTPTNIMAVSNSGMIQIIGRRGSIENISINVPSTITPGTYDLDMFGDYVGMYIANSTPEGTFGADGGSVTIISHDTGTGKIKGTFNFTVSSFLAPGTHSITDGTFDVDYN